MTLYEVSVLVKIAIIIVNWNSGQFLRGAVSSAINQSLPADRIILIDNASSDDSISTLSDLESRIEIRRMTTNLGFAAANNLVIHELEGIEWVALLNPDAVADKDWLRSMIEGIDRHPDARSFASRMMSMDSPGVIDGAGDCYHISGVAWRRFHGCNLNSVNALTDSPVFGPCGGAAVYHRDSFLQCGGFDESYFCYCEDVDLAFRMQLRGMKSWYIHDAVVLHKNGATTGDDYEFADYHGHRNLVWTWLKNMPFVLLLPLLPIHVVVNVVVVLQKMLQGRAGPVIRAKSDALLGCKEPLSKRLAVHAERQLPVWRLWRIMSKSLSRY